MQVPIFTVQYPLTQLAQAGFFAFMLYSDIFRHIQTKPSTFSTFGADGFCMRNTAMNLATLTPEASISSFSRRDISHL